MYFVFQRRTRQSAAILFLRGRKKTPCVCSVQENTDIYVCANSKGLSSNKGRREKYLCGHFFTF